MWIWHLFPRVRLWFVMYRLYADGHRKHVGFERWNQSAFTDIDGNVDRRRRRVRQGERFDVVTERTNWWRHRAGFRFVLESIGHGIAKAIKMINSALDTGLGKVVAAIIIGTAVWLLTKYLAPKLGI